MFSSLRPSGCWGCRAGTCLGFGARLKGFRSAGVSQVERIRVWDIPWRVMGALMLRGKLWFRVLINPTWCEPSSRV